MGANMHTVEVSVPLENLATQRGWFAGNRHVISELKRQGVPVIGKVAIRYVEWGKLTQFTFQLNGIPNYTFRWEGEVLKDNSESDLI